VAKPLEILEVLVHVVDLIRRRRDRQRPGPFDVRVDSVPFERLEIAGVVLEAELLESLDLAREVMEPVVQTVRQRGIGEATVSPRGALGHRIGL
jgi:hypothetical protein